MNVNLFPCGLLLSIVCVCVCVSVSVRACVYARVCCNGRKCVCVHACAHVLWWSSFYSVSSLQVTFLVGEKKTNIVVALSQVCGYI